MHRLTLPITILLLALLVLSAGCSKHTELVRPEQQKTTQNVAPSAACEPGDLNSCENLCTKGNLESCNRMVQAFEDSLPHSLDVFLGHDYIETYDEYDRYEFDKSYSAHYEQLRATTLPFLEQACDEKDLADACWLAGIMHFKKSQLMAKNTPETKLTIPHFREIYNAHQQTAHLLTNACKFGNTAS